MKLFLISVAASLALCKAEGDNLGEATPAPGGRLQNMINTGCPNFDCTGISTNSLECTSDQLQKPERPDREDLDGLDEGAKAKLKSDLQAKKEELRQKILECACCAEMSVEEILAARGDDAGMGAGDGSYRPEGVFSGRPGKGGAGGGSMPGGGSGGKLEGFGSRPGMGMGGSGSGSGGGRGGGDGSSRPEGGPSGRPGMGGGGSGSGSGGMLGGGAGAGGSLGGSGRPGVMGGFGGGGPGGGNVGDGSGRPAEGVDIEAMLAEKCPGFVEECSNMAGQDIDCTRFDQMSASTRGGRRKNILYCGCCRGDGAGGD